MISKEVSNGRRITSIILFILALPFVVLGLIDPLEGGLALVAALVFYLVAFLLAGHGPTKMLWIPYVCAIAIGGLVLMLAIFGVDRVGGEGAFIPLSLGNWIYRIAVMATLVGAVLTVIRSLRNPRG